MASPVIQALEAARLVNSSPKGAYWAFRHPNPDAPPETYRLHRREGNGWRLLLAASRETKAVLNFCAETPEDQAAVLEALRWFGIDGKIQPSSEGVFLHVGGQQIPSKIVGGEKPKK
jgi:hypothetical protein